jgi:choline-sulfatase
MTNNSKQSNPNILWIGVDQMRADSLSSSICQTPHLDQLVRESVNFTHAYSPSSLCTPARGSMFTGLYAFNHGMGTNCDMYHALAKELPDPTQLLHTRLQERGYRCGYTGKWHVGTKLGPVDYGFEGQNIPGYGDLRKEPGFQQYLAENNLNYGPVKDPLYANHDRQTLIGGKWMVCWSPRRPIISQIRPWIC